VKLTLNLALSLITRGLGNFEQSLKVSDRQGATNAIEEDNYKIHQFKSYHFCVVNDLLYSVSSVTVTLES